MGVTRQRQTIQAILSASEEHLTAEQVFEKARKVFPNIGKGTVYRNLNLMADEGVIKRVQIPEQPIRFDKIAIPHQHAVCIKCWGIKDVGDIAPAETRRLVGPKTEIVDHTLLIYVVCEQCSDNTFTKPIYNV